MKILVFAPHAETWAHAFPEALVAESLKKEGHAVLYVGCGMQLQRFCVPMGSHSLTPEADDAIRHRVCHNCCRNDRLIRRNFGLAGPNLADLIGPDEEAEIDRIVTGLSNDAMIDFEGDNIRIGKFALYQLMLRQKRFDTNFSEAEWRDYRIEFRNTLYAWQAAKKLIEREKPDRVLVYNSLYSINRVVCKLAEQKRIPHYFAHAGGNLANRLQTLWVGRGDTFSFMPHLLEQWPRFSKTACSAAELSLITDH
ncbi:MAG TPA: hypothetical protein VFW73_01290, partial [Lacipirellulaceae bacterium]|nr:hypothetical protein [Lacipirellulaceae bacterium]